MDERSEQKKRRPKPKLWTSTQATRRQDSTHKSKTNNIWMNCNISTDKWIRLRQNETKRKLNKKVDGKIATNDTYTVRAYEFHRASRHARETSRNLWSYNLNNFDAFSRLTDSFTCARIGSEKASSDSFAFFFCFSYFLQFRSFFQQCCAFLICIFVFMFISAFSCFSQFLVFLAFFTDCISLGKGKGGRRVAFNVLNERIHRQQRQHSLFSSFYRRLSSQFRHTTNDSTDEKLMR